MDRNSVTWSGYWPASPTTFAADGRFDAGLMRDLMEYYVEAGVSGVLVNGSAGEWWSLGDEERTEVARVACDAVAGRIPVIVGCTAMTAARVTDFAKAAADAGASGVLTTPPPYVHPTQDEILAFYETIDRGVDVPMVAYNWPRGTAVEIDLPALRQIAELEHVVAIKNSTGNWSAVVDCIEALSDKVVIFASLINRRGLAVMREIGGDGYIDGGGIGASFAVPFFKAVKEGDWETARACADKWSKLTASFVNPSFGGHYGAPSAQLKAAMAMLGQPGGHVRAPLLPIKDPTSLAALKKALQDADLLV